MEPIERMKVKIAKILSRVPTKAYYIAVGLLIIPAYAFGWLLLTDQATSYVAILSKVTVNLLLLFFMVGVYVDIYTKKLPRWKGWLIWAVVVIILILFFKYVGGMETRF